jgi:hypothetical protein
MKKLFYFGILGFILFEIANVYFIMPMPGSQKISSIDLAYFLNQYKWIFRILFGVLIITGLQAAFKNNKKTKKIIPAICLLLLASIGYATNYIMAADTMFLQPKSLQLKNAAINKVDSSKIIIGISYSGQAKAYPIQYLGYHHQVFDTIGGKPVIVTYCTVCRTGRVFEPVVKGKVETFRLVGMDHFNAMFEDKTTKSWWRQANGEAIAGKLKGQKLPEFSSTQIELKQWLILYPNSLIMQPDTFFNKEYQDMEKYEAGKSKGKLTRRDSLSWQNKSWIVGITLGTQSKAYDWIQLQKQHVIHDVLDNKPIVIVLAKDNKSFVALQRVSQKQLFTLNNDTLYDGVNTYNLIGTSFNTAVPNLTKVNAYQEYWHSWQTFHPSTKK